MSPGIIKVSIQIFQLFKRFEIIEVEDLCNGRSKTVVLLCKAFLISGLKLVYINISKITTTKIRLDIGQF